MMPQDIYTNKYSVSFHRAYPPLRGNFVSKIPFYEKNNLSRQLRPID